MLCRPRVIGREHVPRSGGVIIAANHCAFVDSLLLCLIISRRLHFIAKDEYFARPGLRGRCQRLFFVAVGQIPVDRRGGGAADDALTTAIGLIRGGRAWAIHPEGTRTDSGCVHRGHTGAMRVAHATGAPVIPVALRGTDRVNPPGSRWWRPGRVEIVVGRPLTPETLADIDVRDATDLLMTELATLAARPYCDAYARRAASVSR